MISPDEPKAAPRTRGARSLVTRVLSGIPRPTVAAAVAICLAMVVAFAISFRRELWTDELYTYYFAKLPSLADVWRELGTGVEQTPPFFYAVTRASLALAGDGPVAMRIPSAVGFGAAGVLLFLFVRNRAGDGAGLLAVLALLASGAFSYSYEARPYGLVMGFGAGALLAWQYTTGPQRPRRYALLALALCLAAAVGSHYYALLLLVPLVVGEGTRWCMRRQPDWPVAVAFSGALIPVVAFSPLILDARKLSSDFWATPDWSRPLGFYTEIYAGPTLALLVIVLVGGVGVACAGRATGVRAAAGPPPWELVALLALAALPIAGMLMGTLVTGAWTARYAVSATLALSALFAFAACQLGRRWRAAPGWLAVLLFVAAVANMAGDYSSAVGASNAQEQRYQLLSHYEPAAPAPIVVGSGHRFFELSHEASRKGGPRLVYLADVPRARAVLGTSTVELGLIELQRIAPLDVRDYETVRDAHHSFLLYGGGPWDWVTGQLRTDGYRLEVIARNGAETLYRATPPAPR